MFSSISLFISHVLVYPHSQMIEETIATLTFNMYFQMNILLIRKIKGFIELNVKVLQN